MTNRIVFAIDDNSLRGMKKFLKHIDTKVALGKMADESFKQCIGMWKGVMEKSFIMTEDDYIKFVMDAGFVDNQEGVIVLQDEGTLMPKAVLSPPIFNVLGDTVPLMVEWIGYWGEVNHDTARELDGWTYDLATGKYWVAA